MDDAAKEGFGVVHSATRILSTVNVLSAIHQVMQKVSFVHKGGENEFHHYKYATEADTINALRQTMLDAGLVMIPSMLGTATHDEQGNTHIVMHYTFYHVASGESLTIRIPASGNDRAKSGAVGDKGIYKAMTGAMKYALRQTFMLETGDDPERGSDADKGGGTGNDDEVQRTARLLKSANTLIKLANACDDETQLQQVWRDNIGNVDLLKEQHPELYTKVRDAFGARKKEVTQPSYVARRHETEE